MKIHTLDSINVRIKLNSG